MKCSKLAALIIAASPIGGEAAAQAPVASAAVESQRAAFDVWLNRLAVILQPLDRSLTELATQWQAESRSGEVRGAVERMRLAVASASATAVRTDAALAALPTPSFAALGLAEEAQPAALVEETRRHAGRVREAMTTFQLIAESYARNDGDAAVRAAGQLLQNARLLLASQLLLSRAALAAVPAGDSRANVAEVNLLMVRAAERSVARLTSVTVSSWSDTDLPRDLVALADELERTAATGERRLAQERARWDSEIAAARRSPGRVAAFRGNPAVLEPRRSIFPLARELAAYLRTQAAQRSDGQLTGATAVALMRGIQAFRARIAATLAGAG